MFYLYDKESQGIFFILNEKWRHPRDLHELYLRIILVKIQQI